MVTCLAVTKCHEISYHIAAADKQKNNSDFICFDQNLKAVKFTYKY